METLACNRRKQPTYILEDRGGEEDRASCRQCESDLNREVEEACPASCKSCCGWGSNTSCPLGDWCRKGENRWLNSPRDGIYLRPVGQKDRGIRKKNVCMRIIVKEDPGFALPKERIKLNRQEGVKGAREGLAFWMWSETCCMVALD